MREMYVWIKQLLHLQREQQQQGNVRDTVGAKRARSCEIDDDEEDRLKKVGAKTATRDCRAPSDCRAPQRCICPREGCKRRRNAATAAAARAPPLTPQVTKETDEEIKKLLADEEIKKLLASAILGIDSDGSVPVPSDEGIARNCCMVLAADASCAPLEVEATTILVLSNLASEEELNNEQDAADVLEDTKEKCEKDFGGVDAALLITPGTGGMQPHTLCSNLSRVRLLALSRVPCLLLD